MTQVLTPVDDGKGNNDPSPQLESSSKEKKIDNFRSKKYVLTIHNYNDAIIGRLKMLCKKCKEYIFGREICPTTQTPHLQVYLKFKNDVWRDSIKKDLEWDGFIVGAKGKPWQNFKYCSKDKDFETNMSYTVKPTPLPVKVISELRLFQKDIENILLKPVNEKKLIVIYDQIGQLGKTDLLKYLVNKYKFPFSYGGKCADVINLIFNNREYYECTENAIAAFNFGRETDMDKISYKAFEQISDGMISNTKFETGCFIMNCPHVLIMCNNLPNLKKVTSNRWIIYTINENFELVPWIDPSLGPRESLLD